MPETCLATDINIEVRVHEKIQVFPGDENLFAKVVARAQEFICEFCAKDGKCKIQFHSPAKFGSPLTASEFGITRLPELDWPDIGKIIGRAPHSGPKVPRTIFLVPEIKFCTAAQKIAADEKVKTNPKIEPPKYEGCTQYSDVSGRPKALTVLATGGNRFPQSAADLEKMAWQVAHEIGHSLGLGDIFGEETEIVKSEGTRLVCPLMFQRVPRVDPGQIRKATLNPEDCKRYESVTGSGAIVKNGTK